MKCISRYSPTLACCLVIGAGLTLLKSQSAAPPPAAAAPAKALDLATEVTALRAEVERLKGLVPDQAHAMEDVGYHVASEKPFIRPQVPVALAEHIINLDPDAK